MRRFFFILLFLPLTLHGQHYAACPHTVHTDESYENPLFERYLSKYDVTFYYLSLEVSNENTILDGFTEIHADVVQDMDTMVLQLIQAHTISSILLDDEELGGYHHTEDAIFIPVFAESGEHIRVKIEYSGDAGQDRGFFAGMSSAWDPGYDQQVTYTLSEPLNARDWFPVKQVLTDKADSVWLDLICSKSLMAGSIGTLVEIEELGHEKHKFKWRSKYPIAYYLISLAVADYQDYSIYAPLANSNDSVLVQNYIYNSLSYLEEWKDEIDETADMIKLFSDLVIDYPFAEEKYGHAVAPMGGGMEHQTMTTIANFNFNLVAHELAHQWYGDHITCGNWQDIWINEGFASYFEYIARQYLISQEEADSWLLSAQNHAMNATGSVYVPENDADNVSRVFNYGLSYKKGACLLHMIRYELNNDSLFFEVLRSYSNKFRFSTARAEDFCEVLDSVSDMDFSCFFDQWYYGQGYPRFIINYHRENDTLIIESYQESTALETPLFKTTFDLNVITESGEKIYRLYQDQNEQVFKIPMKDYVWSIEFDPNNHLLATSDVQTSLPEPRTMALGPNPCNDFIYLKFGSNFTSTTIEIVDIEGTVVLQRMITGNPYRLNISHLKDGPYIVRSIGSAGQYQRKILKITALSN